MSVAFERPSASILQGVDGGGWFACCIALLERQACFNNSEGQTLDGRSTIVKSKSSIPYSVDCVMCMPKVDVAHTVGRIEPFVGQVMSQLAQDAFGTNYHVHRSSMQSSVNDEIIKPMRIPPWVRLALMEFSSFGENGVVGLAVHDVAMQKYAF